jgi:hypothetical protein
MDSFANALIDALGGTTAVANRARTGVSTVHHWRRTGLSASRLDHLRRIAQDELPSVNVEAIAAEHGVELPPIGDEAATSSGTSPEISQQAAA